MIFIYLFIVTSNLRPYHILSENSAEKCVVLLILKLQVCSSDIFGHSQTKICFYVTFFQNHGYFSAPNILSTLYKSSLNNAIINGVCGIYKPWHVFSYSLSLFLAHLLNCTNYLKIVSNILVCTLSNSASCSIPAYKIQNLTSIWQAEQNIETSKAGKLWI